MTAQKSKRLRKGLGVTEWVVVAGAIALVVVGSISVMGTRVDGELDSMADQAGDPTQLVDHFSNK